MQPSATQACYRRQEIVDAQAIVECEFALYIPARAHSAAADDEIPDDAYRMAPLGLLGGWDFNFDDQREIKQPLPQLTALCWCGPHGS